MQQSARPGDVLADRYRLVDLLAESGGGRFWRARDLVLERHVALHAIPEDDERATRITEAARLSATVHDRRLLRVLDADHRDAVAYVVNEWGEGTSLDHLVGTDGPLGSRRAAWVAAEVAEAMATAHEQRVPHGRLVPENVMIDHAGAVRVIGFCVDAALLGLPVGNLTTDVTDLAALLYFLLTGRWPGPSPSAVPAAMRRSERWLRPRQVRAGIPRILDSICDQVLNPYDAAPADHRFNLLTARGLADALGEYVGDPAGLAEPIPLNGVPGAGALAVPGRPVEPTATARASAADPEDQGDTGDGGEATRVVPPAPAAPPPPSTPAGDDDPTRVVPTTPPPPETPDPTVEPPYSESAEGTSPGPVGSSPTTDSAPTQAGMPVFDDETDDVSWLERRTTPPPPPPKLEEPPERPLFAPAPADGGPARRPRPSTRGGNARTGEYWPWDTGTGAGTGSGVIPVTEGEPDDDEVPGRSWLRLALMIAAALLLLVGVVVAYNLGRGKTPLGAEPEPEPAPSSAATPDQPQPITGTTATDLDPQADPPEEYPDLTELAVDGDPETAWRTSTYDDQLGPPPGLKTGVGLVVDLGSSQEVSQIDLTTIGSPTDVSYYLTDQAPSGVANLKPVAQVAGAGTEETTTLKSPATGRYLVVWLTSLPAVEGGFRGEIAEVVASG